MQCDSQASSWPASFTLVANPRLGLQHNTSNHNILKVVSRAVETLADTPKQEEHKLNLRLIGFEAKEGETEKELMLWFNTELLQGEMKLCAKVVIAM